VFVIFIAWAGNIQINDPNIAEYYALILPLENGNILLAILVFLGGLSAVISMVVVASLSLATMLSNNLIIPYGFLNRFLKSNPEKNTKYIKMIRRIAIFSIIIAAYFFYINYSIELSLYSIGLMAFVIIAQLAPSFFLGLIWKRGLSQAAILGIIFGFIVVCYTLITPFIIQSYNPDASFINEGLFGISILKPHALFGLDFLSAPAHAFFWSLLVNTLTYSFISLTKKGNYRERNYAEVFIDSKNLSELQDQALVWKGEAYVSDIKNVLVKFLGELRTKKSLDTFFSKYNIPQDTQMADSRLINFSEKLLTGSIGSASAKILIDSVVKEEEVSLPEVLKILEESKETIVRNKLLKEKSKELSKLTKQLTKVNNQLIEKDRQKDEFLDTLAHELKTPITGIRAATELLLDDIDEMPTDIKEKFLKNMLNDSDRLTRLIQNILDFEKLATGRILLQPKKHSLNKTVIDTLTSLKNIAHKKGVQLECTNTSDHRFLFDEDRIKQVLTNLISNAIKFCEENKGKVVIDYKYNNGNIEVYVIDNGKGIEEEDLPYIFDRFYQSKDQNTRKPEGSGLGLAISKKIIDKHNGKIWALNNEKSGATFGFMLPFD
jgi:signal transduction histidine kinase